MNSLPEFKVDSPRRMLFFCTTRITGSNAIDPQLDTTGTGFYYEASRTPGVSAPVLVTARHVVEHATEVKARLLRKNQAGNPDFEKFEDLTFAAGAKAFTFHPDSNTDIAVCPLALPVQMLELAQRPGFFVVLAGQQCPTPQDLEEIDAIEEVVFVGYPDTLFDTTNHTPIARRGVTATPIQLDWCGREHFLSDAAVFPGSSGSPVVLVQPATRVTSSGIAFHSTPRVIFLGVLTSVYETSAEVEHGRGNQAGSVRISLGLGLVEKWHAVEQTIDALFAAQGLNRDALSGPGLQVEVRDRGAASA